jgi:hypothetical protein
MAEDYVQRMIAAAELGRQHRQQDEDRAFQKQVRELEINRLKHDIGKYKLQDQADEIDAALKQHALQALISGGPSGQATVETPPPTFQPPERVAPTNMSDLLQGIRQVGTMQAVPGVPQSKEVGTPPPLADIPIPSLGMTIPGWNRELAQQQQTEEALRAQQIALRLKGAEPFTLAEGARRIIPSLTGGPPQAYENPKPLTATGPALIQGVRTVYPNFDQLPVDEKLKAVGAYSSAQQKAAQEQLPMTQERFNQELAFIKAREKGQQNSMLNALRELQYQSRTQSAPGQVVSAATGLPVELRDAASTRLGQFQTALDQSSVVSEALRNLGDTGAIKGYVLKEGLYWPVVQDKITPEQAEAVSETQRLINAYLYAVSGKQINEQEMARIARTAPDLRFTAGANEKILQNFVRYVTTERDNFLKVNGWKIKGAESNQTPPPPATKPTTPPKTLVGPNGQTLTLGSDGKYHASAK